MSAATRTSRVALGPTEPEVSAAELAKGLDEAENHPLPLDDADKQMPVPPEGGTGLMQP